MTDPFRVREALALLADFQRKVDASTSESTDDVSRLFQKLWHEYRDTIPRNE